MSRRTRNKNRRPDVGTLRKAAICNIWINLGNANPFSEKVEITARKIAKAIGFPFTPMDKLSPALLEFVRDTRPELLANATARRKARVSAPNVSTKEEFYKSWDWRTLRMEVLKEHGRACQCCGAEPGMKTSAGEPVRICVDHIKPLSKFWHLRLDRKNLQVLCDECNQGKGNWDQTDFRPQASPDEWIIESDGIDPAIVAQLSVHGETLQ